ncbi:hypothetical protein Tco_1284035 [Tanacetum coccineum]
MKREIKRLKRSRIPLVKVRWNSRRGPEFTWEREDSFKQKYPQLFTNRASSSTTRLGLGASEGPEELAPKEEIEGVEGLGKDFAFPKAEPIMPVWSDILEWCIPMAHKNNTTCIVGRLLVSASSYYVWQERNNMIHNKGTRNVEQLGNVILDVVRLKLASIKFRKKIRVFKEGVSFDSVIYSLSIGVGSSWRSGRLVSEPSLPTPLVILLYDFEDDFEHPYHTVETSKSSCYVSISLTSRNS